MKTLQTTANEIIDQIKNRAELASVATIGYKGELPAGLSEDDRFDLLNQIQDLAKCIDAGACRK